MGISRREMLKRVGVMIGVAAGLRISPRALAQAQARSQGIAALGDALVSLTPAEAETLRAIIARLIPADENGPGALEARADRFIDRALGGSLKNLRSTYSSGLAGANAYAQTSKGSPFAKLSAADQDAVLTQMQQESPQFFNLVRTHT